MADHYKLVGRKVVACSFREWAEFFSKDDARMIANFQQGPIYVSTVFIGLNHRFGREPGPPIVFETMIFGGVHDGEQRRYATYKEALDGHNKIVAALRTVGDSALRTSKPGPKIT